MLLRAVTYRPPGGDAGDRFPFHVPTIRSLTTLEFPTPVTFLVGENGSGKSTFLEALAVACALQALGSELRVEDDTTLHAQRQLAGHLRLTWERRRATRGFFLRAEDFFGFTKHIARLRADMEEELAGIDEAYRDRSALAKQLRVGPLRGSLRELEASYGIDPDARSHGESFLQIFRQRLVPNGLYLLDEPEAPLSPQSQLALIAMLGEMTQAGAQFIVASHSPVLLAFPGATIYSFDEVPVRQVGFGELEHVNLTRDFLNDPERYLRQLGFPPA